jgi:hypothetical protein
MEKVKVLSLLKMDAAARADSAISVQDVFDL